MIQGIFIQHGNNNQKFPVDVSFDSQHLEFRLSKSDKSELKQFKYSELAAEVGGNANSLLFFKTLKEKDTLYFEITKDLKGEISKFPMLKDLTQQVWSAQNQRRLGSMFWITFVLAIIASLVIFRGPIFGGLGASIPFSWEKKVADQVFNPKVSPEQKIIIDEMENLFKNLQVPKTWQGKFTFHISSTTEPNAYATIGGHIFVNKGLITELQSAEQLVGVVAHEMAHVKRRHVVRSLAQAIGLFSVLQLVLGDITGLAAIILDQGGPLLNLQYTRELEMEADQDALQLLIKSEINPIGLSESIKIIMEQSKRLISQSPGSEVLNKLQKIEILSSHPEPEKRIQSLAERANELTSGKNIKPLVFDYKKFKGNVKERF